MAVSSDRSAPYRAGWINVQTIGANDGEDGITRYNTEIYT